MISELTLFTALKELFKSTPSLEEFIEAHNPTDVFQVEELERRYNRMVSSHRFWAQ